MQCRLISIIIDIDLHSYYCQTVTVGQQATNVIHVFAMFKAMFNFNRAHVGGLYVRRI
jgi:hypothetical protein